jgi:hypothetical protein
MSPTATASSRHTMRHAARRDGVRTEPRTLSLAWPSPIGDGWSEDFFVGAWCPSGSLHVDWGAVPAELEAVSVRGGSWAMLGSTAHVADGRVGLVHRRTREAAPGALDAVAFRGYVLDPAIHSWSAPSATLAYWSADPRRTHNGVFAAARVGPSGRYLELVTDAFGVAALYWRRIGDVILFATSPRFLGADDEELDPIARRLFMHRGGVLGERSLVPEARRVPPGTVLRFSDAHMPQAHAWFAYDALPEGTERVTDRRLAEAEESLRVAVARCHALMPGQTAELPLLA